MDELSGPYPCVICGKNTFSYTRQLCCKFYCENQEYIFDDKTNNNDKIDNDKNSFELIILCKNNLITYDLLKTQLNKLNKLDENIYYDCYLALIYLCDNESINIKMLKLLTFYIFQYTTKYIEKKSYQLTPLKALCNNKAFNIDMISLFIPYYTKEEFLFEISDYIKIEYKLQINNLY